MARQGPSLLSPLDPLSDAMPTIQGDGASTVCPDTPVREGSRAWALSVPDTGRALGSSDGLGEPQRPAQGAERAGQRILRTAGLLTLLGAVAALTVPITRTVELDGQLVPERVVPIRVAETGLLTEIHVAAGDTVLPRQLVARLHSPDLDELVRTSAGHDPALLVRRSRLEVFTPPWSERQPDGTAAASTFWSGGVVLTEDLAEQRGSRVDAGDVVLELAAIGSNGRVHHVVRAWAPEREAQRVRPGMPAQLTFIAIPQDRPRQASGVVRRVSLAPDSLATRWRVEVGIDADALTRIVGDAAAELRAGFSVEIAVMEKRETLARTAGRWASARWTEHPG